MVVGGEQQRFSREMVTRTVLDTTLTGLQRTRPWRRELQGRAPGRVLRKIDVGRWEAGELVEVLDKVSWKTATVLEELSGRYYLVRLLGAALELTVHKVNLRARQCWQDETWVMIGKVSCSVKSSTLTGSYVNPNLKPHETSVASVRVLKRPSSCDWCESAESFTGSPKKKLRSCRSGKMRLQASVNNGFRPVRYDESDDTSTSFLDGSSSQEAGSCSSDAESSKGVREEATGGTVRRSCRPELYTYRSTLGKLFASGPLDWNQEASLTDLRRLSLNVSTDEHLMEIRNLKSTHKVGLRAAKSLETDKECSKASRSNLTISSHNA
ncbi:hypothetical protein Bca101_094531 [Brassica carinata]